MAIFVTRDIVDIPVDIIRGWRIVFWLQLSGYTKLFQSILASTIWSADDKTRIVWITLMAMANQHGVAEGSIPGLATFARVSIEDCERALNELLAPDAYSRSKEFEGRRIENVEGGWRLLNHRKYREKMGMDERREYLRKKQAERRAKRKAERQNVNTVLSPVAQMSTWSTHAEAEAEAEASRSGYLRDLDTSIDKGNQEQGKTQNTPPPQSRPTNGNGNGNDARSKRPIFSGQRLTVHEWMLTDCMNTLGKHAEDFDLHSWFFELDARAVREGLVLQKRDGGAWLQSELVAEAQRRGLPLKFASATPDKMTEDEKWRAVAKMGPVKRDYAK